MLALLMCCTLALGQDADLIERIDRCALTAKSLAVCQEQLGRVGPAREQVAEALAKTTALVEENEKLKRQLMRAQTQRATLGIVAGVAVGVLAVGVALR